MNFYNILLLIHLMLMIVVLNKITLITKISGIFAAILELTIFTFFSRHLRNYLSFNNIDLITYYWLCFTILTGLWELTYLKRKKNISIISQNLINTKSHVWFNKYPLSIVIPKNFSSLFYAEYGAWSDREYMTNKNYWSNLVEGTHCLFCALFSLIALIYYRMGNMENYTISLSVAMGNQFMNSVLYLGQYVIQCYDPNSLNFDSKEFPSGYLLSKRPFMWVNLPWILFPSYIILNSLRIHNLGVFIGLLSKIM